MRHFSLSALVLLVALPATRARADTLEEIFGSANTAYYAEDYDAAADGYRRLIELGVIDADVSFNLATAEARRGRYGVAIQHFERALWLRPGDDDASEGLDNARRAVGRRRARQHGEAEVDTGPPLVEALFGGLSRETFAVGTLALETITFGALIGLLFVKRESVRLALGITAPLAGIGALVFGTGLMLAVGWLEDGPPAVVLTEGASVREGPTRGAQERHRALEGQRAWILETQRDWSRVRVNEVGEGWLHEDDLGPVRVE